MNLKKILAPLALGIIAFSSCKNKLNIQAPYKDVTIVYGLLDQNDATHYFRINKGFEGSGNAYAMAKQYDSIYYPVGTLTVQLQDSNPTTDLVVKTITLDTTTTVPLGAGTFSYPKQLLYYTNASLNINDYYNLIITNTKTGKKLKGSTLLLQDISFGYPKNLASRNIPLDLGSEPNPTQVTWNSTATAVIYQLNIIFYYDSQTGNGPRVAQTPLQLVLAQQTASSAAGDLPMSYDISCQQLFSLLLSSIPVENGVTRYPDSLGFVFTTGTGDLNTYIQLSQPPTGINQDVPSYSDVENGVGLYTARHVQTYYKGLSMALIDSLVTDPRLMPLNFQQ